MRRSLTILLALFISCVSVANAGSSDPEKARRLSRKLSRLQLESNGFPRVRRLAITLIKLDPAESYKYFKTSIKALHANIRKKAGNRLQKQTLRIIQHSDLPRHRIAKIDAQIQRFLHPHVVTFDDSEAEQGAAANP